MEERLRMAKDRVVKVKLKTRDYKRYVKNYKGNPRLLLIDFRCIHKGSYGTINYGSRKRIKWASPEQLQKKIDEYFESCYDYIYDRKSGSFVTKPDGTYLRGLVKPFTTTGLAMAIGMDRTMLLAYSEDEINALGFPTDEDYEGPTYGEIARAARNRIQEFAETRLFDRDGFNGGKFVLDCSFDWVGRKELAEIAKMKKELELKERELDLREKQLDLAAAEEDNEPINITIRRAGE